MLIRRRLTALQFLPEMCLCAVLLEFVDPRTDVGTALCSCITCSIFFVGECSAFPCRAPGVPPLSCGVALIIKLRLTLPHLSFSATSSVPDIS